MGYQTPGALRRQLLVWERRKAAYLAEWAGKGGPPGPWRDAEIERIKSRMRPDVMEQRRAGHTDARTMWRTLQIIRLGILTLGLKRQPEMSDSLRRHCIAWHQNSIYTSHLLHAFYKTTPAGKILDRLDTAAIHGTWCARRWNVVHWPPWNSKIFAWDKCFVEEHGAVMPRMPKAEVRERPRWEHFERAWRELRESEEAVGLPWGEDGAWAEEELKKDLASTPVKNPDGKGMWPWTEKK